MNESGANNKGFILSAPASYSGKTLIMLALLRHFSNQKLPVMPAKSGPDYIDPLFHQKAARTDLTVNFDSWAMRLQSLQALQSLATDKLLIIEGAMGLYDGASGALTGSTADLAKILQLPIIMILPVRRQSRSVCAVLHGFIAYQPEIPIAGVILNGVGSKTHERGLRLALQQDFPHMPILGALPWREGDEGSDDSDWHLESRHLGLVQPETMQNFDKRLDRISAQIIDYIDIYLLKQIAKQSPSVAGRSNSSDKSLKPLLNLNGIQHLAIAYDEAFRFIYKAQIAFWQQNNIEISFFSPLANQAPNENADMIFLPGGYPELFGEQISHANNFIAGLKQAEQAGKWIYGECGGYMVLGQGLEDGQGMRYPMAGLLAHSTNMKAKKRHLGLRKVTLNAQTPFQGKCFRGHEFHYSELYDALDANHADDGLQSKTKPLFSNVTNALDEEMNMVGEIKGRVFGSYIHLIDHDES